MSPVQFWRKSTGRPTPASGDASLPVPPITGKAQGERPRLAVLERTAAGPGA